MIHVRTGKVQIYDTDASGLVLFSAPLRWFVDAEDGYNEAFGLWEVLGLNRTFAEAGPMAPTRAYEVWLDSPMQFHDRYEQQTWISRVGRTSYTVSHLVTVEGRRCIRGSVRRSLVERRPDG
ncbi:MAG TPA: thioesterase family protein, partial [Acidimicrobiales bacterium]|nr:thioesterase family protein [Acidimicrobiales bacterium]